MNKEGLFNLVKCYGEAELDEDREVSIGSEQHKADLNRSNVEHKSNQNVL